MIDGTGRSELATLTEDALLEELAVVLRAVAEVVPVVPSAVVELVLVLAVGSVALVAGLVVLESGLVVVPAVLPVPPRTALRLGDMAMISCAARLVAGAAVVPEGGDWEAG